MTNDLYKRLAINKTDDELRERIDNREKYLPETVEAAVDELQVRGFQFSEEELRVIAEDMQARRDLAGSNPDNINPFRYSDTNNQIQYPDAPLLYSKRAIYVFSILFSVLFGSLMLAINVGKVQKNFKPVLVAIFGFAYTAFTVVLAQEFNLPTGTGIIVSMLGGYVLNAFFWNRFIGKSTLYRLKPIWVPLVVALILTGLFMFIIFKYGMA